jgi:hypothetical protein
MDISRRNRLVDKLKAQSISVGQQPGPTVSLEDFFEGNDDLGSIGCNLSAHPGVDTFYFLLREIRSRQDVQDVLVEIRDFADEHCWPFTDTVFVLTSMDRGELSKAVAKLNPDEVGQFPLGSIPKDLPAWRHGMTVMGIWWD